MSSWHRPSRVIEKGQVRPVELVRTEAQVRPHEGFKSTALTVPERLTTPHTDDPSPALANPPEWTNWGINCLDQWQAWEELDAEEDPYSTELVVPNVTNQADRAVANKLCRGCPAAPGRLGGRKKGLGPCLTEALANEGNHRASMRCGVRGGLTPGDRTTLARRIAERAS